MLPAVDPRRAVFILCVLAPLASAAVCGANETPSSADRELTIPLSEVSGLTFRRLTGGGAELLAVGDDAHEIVALPVADGEPDVARARRIALPPAGGGAKKSELEGIAVDRDGHVWLLVERGEIRAVDIASDSTTARELWRKPIVLPPSHPLAEDWQARPNRRAEGLALIEPRAGAAATDRRVFIVKQSDPAALIELDEEAARFVARDPHLLIDMDDASDLAQDGDALLIIGARSRRICVITPLPAAHDTAPAPLSCRRTLPLPTRLGGDDEPRWEGLAMTPEGALWIAADHRATHRPNLARIGAHRAKAP